MKRIAHSRAPDLSPTGPSAIVSPRHAAVKGSAEERTVLAAENAGDFVLILVAASGQRVGVVGGQNEPRAGDAIIVGNLVYIVRHVAPVGQVRSWRRLTVEEVRPAFALVRALLRTS